MRDRIRLLALTTMDYRPVVASLVAEYSPLTLF
nr:MAG TPA: hypothetical protein [Caudoviricetes sp.]